MARLTRIETASGAPGRAFARLGALASLAAAFAWHPQTSLAQSPTPTEQSALAARQDLETALKQLADLRETVAKEKIPLTRKVRELESRLGDLRREYEKVTRDTDEKTLEIGTLREQVESRHQEEDYLATLLDEYARNFETGLHISELERYGPVLHAAHLAMGDGGGDPVESMKARRGLVQASLDRIEALLGGETFEGRAVDPDGAIRDVDFVLVGPVALFADKDGGRAGLVEQKLGSLEPRMVFLPRPELQEGIRRIAATGSGVLPLDPSLGDALKIAETRDTLVQHAMKGGPVMIPILLLAAAALVTALAKWIQMARVPRPRRGTVEAILDALKRGDLTAVRSGVAGVPGPAGEMLRSGVEHLCEPRELLEEVMYEKTLETRLRLQSFLPFVAMSASAAPLLGLLGTVTGMINTFKLITVFGSGDAKTLSSGISEALVTTEFGLIVAIPSLLLYAYLSRKSRGIVDRMEKTAVKFLNRLGSPAERAGGPTLRPRPASLTAALAAAAAATSPASGPTGQEA